MKRKGSFKSKITAMLMAVLLIFSVVSLPLVGNAASYDEKGATTFTFSDTGITVSEGSYSGYKIEGTDLTINDQGTYVVTGTSKDGSVTIKKGTTGVTLVLSNLTLTSSDTAPISCNKSTEVTILAEGTNSLTDSEQNNDETYPDSTEAENAVIKCKDGSVVLIGGTGTLNIEANGKNGLKGGATTEEEGEASLTIKDLTLNITANVNDALKADNGLFIKSGTITVSAEDDAIKSDYDLTIGEEGGNGPTIQITKSKEGIEAATLTINSGDISVAASDDGMNAANSDLGNYNFSLTINGGKVYVNADGDGIDSNGSLTVNGGYVEVYAASQSDNSPYDAEGTFAINGGTVVGVGHSGMARGVSTSQNYIMFGSSGMGGFGGRGGNFGMGGNGNMDRSNGGRPDFQNGEMPNTQNGEMPQMPEGQNGNMTRGRGGNFGQMPQNNGTLPQFETNQGTPNGEMPQMQSGSIPNGAGSGNQTSGNVSLTKGQSFSILDESGNVIYSGTATRNADYVFYSSDQVEEGATYSLQISGETVATATANASGNAQDMGSFFGGQGQNPTEAVTEKPASQNSDISGKTSSNGSEASSGVKKNGKYKDVENGAWYEEAVSYVTDAALMNGVSRDSFAPESDTTRGMFITVLYRLEGSPEVSENAGFADVSEEDYYYNAVQWGVEQGIVTGMSETAFAPNETITREQMATMLFRYLSAKGITVVNKNVAYQDEGSVTDYARDAVKSVSALGILEGDKSGNFAPRSHATRAQIATVLMRLSKKVK